VHCSIRHTYVASGVRGRVLAVLGGAAEALVLRRADRVIALTPRLAHTLCASGVPAERVRVVPSGVVPELFAVAAPDPYPQLPRPRVLFVGRLQHQKGVGVLLEAAARTSSRAHVVLVGDGPARRQLHRAARKLGLAERVHVTGFVPHRAVPAAMRHADVLVLPSLYEELGSTLLEAMQAGVPIVASRTGGIPDAVGEAAVLVPPRSVEALARAIDEVLMNSALAERLVAAGRERVRRFDWHRLAREVLDVYDEALGR
jgi:glycogen(starch) synthase